MANLINLEREYEKVKNIEEFLDSQSKAKTIYVTGHSLGGGISNIACLRIAQKFEKDPNRGFKTYIKHSLKEFINLKPIRVDIEAGGQKIELDAFMLCIANTSEFGNGFKISPKSSVRDGMLELILVRPFPKWKAAIVAARFFNKKAHKSKYIQTVSATEGRIDLSKNNAHYDGEFVEEHKSINFRVLPKSLKIVVPKKN